MSFESTISVMVGCSIAAPLWKKSEASISLRGSCFNLLRGVLLAACYEVICWTLNLLKRKTTLCAILFWQIPQRATWNWPEMLLATPSKGFTVTLLTCGCQVSACNATSVGGDFWAWPVEILVFASLTGYMFTSTGSPLLNWGICCEIPLKWSVIFLHSWTSTGYFSNSTSSSELRSHRGFEVDGWCMKLALAKEMAICT